MFRLVPRFRWGSEPHLSIDSGAPLDIEWPEYQTSTERRYVVLSSTREVMIEFDFAAESDRLSALTLVSANRSAFVTDKFVKPRLRTNMTLGWRGPVPVSSVVIPALSLTIFDNALMISLNEDSPSRWDGGFGLYIGSSHNNIVGQLALELPTHMVEWIRGERGRYDPSDETKNRLYTF